MSIVLSGFSKGNPLFLNFQVNKIIDKFMHSSYFHQTKIYRKLLRV